MPNIIEFYLTMKKIKPQVNNNNAANNNDTHKK